MTYLLIQYCCYGGDAGEGFEIDLIDAVRSTWGSGDAAGGGLMLCHQWDVPVAWVTTPSQGHLNLAARERKGEGLEERVKEWMTLRNVSWKSNRPGSRSWQMHFSQPQTFCLSLIQLFLFDMYILVFVMFLAWSNFDHWWRHLSAVIIFVCIHLCCCLHLFTFYSMKCPGPEGKEGIRLRHPHSARYHRDQWQRPSLRWEGNHCDICWRSDLVIARSLLLLRCQWSWRGSR